jgi:hypothetical protein
MVGRAIPAIIHIKDFSQSPHQKQYPLRPEAREGLIPIIKGLKEQGLLIECSSPCNTPTFGAGRGPTSGGSILASPLHLTLEEQALTPLVSDVDLFPSLLLASDGQGNLVLGLKFFP